MHNTGITISLATIVAATLLAGPAASTAAQPSNLAPLAKLEGKGENLETVTDGIKGGKDEWFVQGERTMWGRIAHPEVTLKWDQPRTINKVVIYDRSSGDDHMGACELGFSDGSKVQVWAVPNDGTPKTVVFEPRTVTSMSLRCVDGVGTRIGLSELEVLHDPAAKPEVRERTLTDLVSHVDPTIETGRGRWIFCTPGSRPFGMVSASPYTRNINQFGGGYNYNSTEILGFAQIHNWMFSGINLMPVTGEVDPNLGEQGWKSPFSHDTEVIEPGKEFRIVTHDNSPENIYIQKAKLNGKPLDTFQFPHRDFAKGGLLEIWLGPQPNKNWGQQH